MSEETQLPSNSSGMRVRDTSSVEQAAGNQLQQIYQDSLHYMLFVAHTCTGFCHKTVFSEV